MPELPAVLPGSAWSGRPPAGLVRVARGQYLRPTSQAEAWRRRREVSLARLVAVLRVCPAAVALSHESAALLHGVAVRWQEPDVHVVQLTSSDRCSVELPRMDYADGTVRVLDGDRSSGPDAGRAVVLRRHVRSALPPGAIVTAHGLPVTDLMTTLVDCLTDLDPLSVLIAGDGLARALVEPDRYHRRESDARWTALRCEAAERIEELPRHQGKARARRLLPLLSPWSESWGESTLRFILLKAGLPVPLLQLGARTEDRLYFLDLALPGMRIAIEFDGRLKYVERDVLYEEKVREDALRALGWSVVRVRTEQLRAPDVVVDMVLRAAARSGHQLTLESRAWMGWRPRRRR